MQVFLPLPMRPTIVNVYLVRAGAEWTLIDTGMNTEDSVAAFRGALADVGIAPERITRLVGTHHHVDHFGTSGPYRTLTHAQVWLHPLEAERATLTGHVGGESTDHLRLHGVPDVPADQRLPPPSRFFGTWYAPAAPDHLLGDEDEIPLGDGRSLEAIWTPGHTRGHLCFLHERTRSLFSGDHIPGGKGTVIIDPPEGDMRAYIASLWRLLALPIDTLFPAHGSPQGAAERRIRGLIEHRLEREAKVSAALDFEPRTLRELVERAYADTPRELWGYAERSLLAHLMALKEDGRAEVEGERWRTGERRCVPAPRGE